MSLTNLYIGLKAGWGFGVAITACILSFAIWTAFYKVGLVKTKMTILENNCMQSTASSAGYSTGGTLISAFAAYIMLNGRALALPLMLCWVFFLAVLGVTMAIPMKRQMINIEQLRFPSGIAAAETLRALHSHGEKAMRSAKALGLAGVLAAVNQFWADGPRLIDRLRLCTSRWALRHRQIDGPTQHLAFGKAWMDRTVMLQWDPIFLAAGALTGLRVSASMMLGGTLCWAVYVPDLAAPGRHPPESGFDDLVHWTLWGGAACMVTSGLFSFALQWRSMVRAMGNVAGIFPRTERRAKREMDAIETPMSWFLAGQLVSLVALAWLAKASFQMPYWQSAIAVPLAFLLALVACRVTGETDNTPVGAMGQTTQLIFGGISPPADMAPDERYADEREHHGRRRGLRGRSVDRSEERLFARRKSAQAVPRPIRRHLCRDAGDGPLLPGHGAQRQGAWRRAVPAPVGTDFAGRLGGAEPRDRVAGTRESLVDGHRRAGGHPPAAAGSSLSETRKMDPVGRRRRPGVDLPMVL